MVKTNDYEGCENEINEADHLLRKRNDLISYHNKNLKKKEENAQIIKDSNLSGLEKLTPRLMECLIESTRNKKESAEHILDQVCKEVNCQVASIFLISKDNMLERFAIKGKDKEGKPIEDTWLKGEKYAVGESFTGSAAASFNGEYGRVTGELGKYEHLKYRQQYTDKLGDLYCAMALPLNGQNSTYGVLRIINKIDDEGIIDRQEINFNPSAVAFYTGVASATLSNIKRDSEDRILNCLTSFANFPVSSSKDIDYEMLYEKIFEYLVGEETDFKVAILYKKNFSSGEIETVHFSKVSGESDPYRDDLKKIGKKFTEEIGKKFTEGKSSYPFFPDFVECKCIEGIDEPENQSRLSEHELGLLKDSKLESFGVFPLMFEGRFMGAIALFIGYKYKFFTNNRRFLRSFSSLLAILVNQQTRRERLEKLKDISEEWLNQVSHLSSTNKAVIQPSYQQIIGIGQDAIPFLLERLKEPNHPGIRWFWALRAISGENPIPKEMQGKSKEMIKAWINWGVQKGYIHNS